MKTTTIRLADRQADLVEVLAQIDKCKASDVLRAAVRSYINARAASDTDFAAERERAVKSERAESEEQIRKTFGEEALEKAS